MEPLLLDSEFFEDRVQRATKGRLEKWCPRASPKDETFFAATDEVTEQSRDGRMQVHLTECVQRLTGYGVGYRSFTEQYLDSCGMFRDAVISILAVIAKQERVRLSERTLAGLARARAQGQTGGRPRIHCDHRKLMKLHESENSLGKIADELSLTKTTVYRIIRAAKLREQP
jgi:DNA invertase Pin-like site-specific DNA recombinase